RATHIVGRATQAAATALRELIERERGMTLRDDRLYASGDASGVALEDAALALEVTATFASDPPGADRVPDYTFGAYAIGLEVDAETGALRLTDALFV